MMHAAELPFQKNVLTYGKLDNYSMLHVLKSLTYFEDAEKEPMPDLLAPLDWEQVKRYFTGEARGLGGVTK